MDSGAGEGIYPAYHMNKPHWSSLNLNDAEDDMVEFLVNVRFEATKDKKKHKKIINPSQKPSFKGKKKPVPKLPPTKDFGTGFLPLTGRRINVPQLNRL